MLQVFEHLACLGQRPDSAEKGREVEIVLQQQESGLSHSLCSKVEGAENFDLVVMDFSCVKAGSGPAWTAAKEDKGATPLDKIKALLPNLNLARAFYDQVVLALQAGNQLGLCAQPLTNGQTAGVPSRQSDVVDPHVAEGGHEHEADGARANDEDPVFVPGKTFMDSLGHTGQGFKQAGEGKAEVGRLVEEVEGGDPGWNQKVLGVAAQHLRGHDGLA